MLRVPCETRNSIMLSPILGFCGPFTAGARTPKTNCQCIRGRGPRVQENPDRQSRRDRLPHHQDRPADGHRHGRGLFRSRPQCAACRRWRTRRWRSAPPPSAQSYLSIDRIVAGLPRDGRRRRASRLWISLRARSVRRGAGTDGVAFIGPNAKAIAAMGDKIESKKLAPSGRRFDRAGLRRRDPRRRRMRKRSRARSAIR